MCIFAVTPLAGVWIEILVKEIIDYLNEVTPLAGVWIEIMTKKVYCNLSSVTPLAGVWIEINIASAKGMYKKSLPLRECGLKFGTFIAEDCGGGHSPCGSVD